VFPGTLISFRLFLPARLACDVRVRLTDIGKRTVGDFPAILRARLENLFKSSASPSVVELSSRHSYGAVDINLVISLLVPVSTLPRLASLDSR